MSTFLQSVIFGLSSGATFALLALSISLVFTTTGAVNFATASMGTLCAFLFFWASTTLGLGWVAGLAIALVGSAVLGALVERGIVRPLAGADLFRVVLATMGLDILLNNGTQHVFGSGVRPLGLPLPTGAWNVFGLSVDIGRLFLIAVALVLVVALAAVLRGTRLGVGMRAYAQDPRAAALMGIPERTVTRWTWILASVLGTVGALLVSGVTVLGVGAIEPTFIQAFTAAVLGGLASLSGAVVGGLVLGVLGALSTTYAPEAVTTILPLVIILAMLLLRPAGLFGRAAAERA